MEAGEFALNTESDALAEAWDAVRLKLRSTHGDAAYKSWLKNLVVLEVGHGQVRLAAPTRFVREWIVTHYLDDLVYFWQGEVPDVSMVDVCVRSAESGIVYGENSAVGVLPSVDSPIANHSQASRVASETAKDNVIAFGAPPAVNEGMHALSAALDPRFTFDNFVVGKPNELAFAAARRVAESPEVAPGCNPLFLYGGVGLGKTHLMHAIAWHISRQMPQRKVLYLSAEKFMYQFVRALKDKETMSFKEQFRSVDVLMVDDVQFICGKESTQEEFFHTFNALVDQNKQVVISGDRSPSDMDGIEERMRSRLGWGLVADIHATTFELRLGILQAKVERLGSPVPPKVLEFLAHKITSNVRELEGALNRIVAHSTLVGQAITLENTEAALQDLLRACGRRVSIEDIQKKVAEHFNIKVAEMHSARRSRAIARPRQVAMYLSKQLTAKSLPEIGRKFGGKDHTTVIHAVKKVEELCAADNEFAEDVELLTRMLRG